MAKPIEYTTLATKEKDRRIANFLEQIRRVLKFDHALVKKYTHKQAHGWQKSI